jgi:hypothetical protein
MTAAVIRRISEGERRQCLTAAEADWRTLKRSLAQRLFEATIEQMQSAGQAREAAAAVADRARMAKREAKDAAQAAAQAASVVLSAQAKARAAAAAAYGVPDPQAVAEKKAAEAELKIKEAEREKRAERKRIREEEADRLAEAALAALEHHEQEEAHFRELRDCSRQVVLAAVHQNGLAINLAQPVDNFVKNDHKIVATAFRQLGYIHGPPADASTRELVLAAVRHDWKALGSVADKFRADREIVLAAVAQDGRALYSASPALRSDPDVVKLAVEGNALALRHASAGLQTDRHVVRAARRASRRAYSTLDWPTADDAPPAMTLTMGGSAPAPPHDEHDEPSPAPTGGVDEAAAELRPPVASASGASADAALAATQSLPTDPPTALPPPTASGSAGGARAVPAQVDHPHPRGAPGGVSFSATYEWQELASGVVVPPGLEIDIPLDGGSKRARIPPQWQLTLSLSDALGLWRVNVSRDTTIATLCRAAAEHAQSGAARLLLAGEVVDERLTVEEAGLFGRTRELAVDLRAPPKNDEHESECPIIAA